MTSPAPSQKSQPPAINAATAPSNAPKISPTIETFFMTLSIAANHFWKLPAGWLRCPDLPG
jgi:hypothetical protein